MGYYGVIFPEFWTGRTGRELREYGKDAQLLGLYLATNRHANMLGLYRLLIDDIRHETGLGLKGIERGLVAACDTDFAKFDAGTSYVWVRHMVRFRLALKVGEVLDANDKRVKGVNRIYRGIDPNPFLGDFFEMYHETLLLEKRRKPQGVVMPYTISGPLQGAMKPLISQDQDQGSGDQDQVQETERLTPHEPSPARRNVRQIRSIVFKVVKAAPANASFTDLKEIAKEACAGKLAYDADIVGSALEQALARKAKA